MLLKLVIIFLLIFIFFNLKNFLKVNKKILKTNKFITFYPKYIIENIGLIFIALLAYKFSNDVESSQKILPIKLDKFSKQNNIDRNKFIILMPGRLTNWKGQKTNGRP